MTQKKARTRAIVILLLGQSVPFVACTGSDEQENIRDENECQNLVPCGAARFSFSDTLPPGGYTLRLELPDDEIDCSFRVASDGDIQNDCDLDLTDEYLEIDPQGQPVTLEITDEKGCSVETSMSAADYTNEVTECDVDCQGAAKTVDLSECAAAWYCETGYDWSERCEENTSFPMKQLIEGCGYTWIKSLYTDAERNTIIDADGVVVFQEVRDPLSPGSSCLGETIPDCADLPDTTTERWPDVAIQSRENECLDDGMVMDRPECAIGYDWSEVCDDFSAGLGTQVIEGCGYTWIRGHYADSARDTIIDADGLVVFQEWRDPQSTINPLGCLGGAIPDCADLPDDANNDWDAPSRFQGNECPDDGMGGAGGAGGAGGSE